jgi:hypothetical protein
MIPRYQPVASAARPKVDSSEVRIRRHHSPTSAMQPAGQDPGERSAPGTTALFSSECQSFLDNGDPDQRSVFPQYPQKLT